MNLYYLMGSFLGPLVILLLNYLLRKKANMEVIDHIKILIDASIHLFGFAFFLFFIYYEKKIDTGWSPVSILTLNIPFFLILLGSYIYFEFIKKNKNKTL
jgi:hypothetical protein